jgi:hypothetical protein
MPAVRAIANVPQNVTRAVARRTFGAAGPSSDRSQKGQKAQGRSRHDRDKRSSGRYDNHQQGHCRTHGKRYGRCQCGLHGACGGDLGNAKLIAAVGGKSIFRHELPGDLPRKVPIDAALDVDIGKLIELKFGGLVQLLAFARQIRPFGVGLRTDGHIFAGGHRHRASHQSRDTRD